jgi:hypothetical protein
MHKSATKCNETIGKRCKNKHGASKIIDTLETYHPSHSSLDLWKLPGKIRLQELVSSNSKNISCVALLKHKKQQKTGNWHCGDLLIG